MTLLNIILFFVIFLNLSTIHSLKGASDGSISQVPYTVAVVKLESVNSTEGTKGKFTLVCGGTIVSPNFILSAAHCYRKKGLGPRAYRIKVRCEKSSKIGLCGNTVRVEKILYHPKYSSPPYHDVALLRTVQELRTSNKAKPIKVAPFKGGSYTKCKVSGYGPVSDTAALTIAYVTIKSDNDCIKNQNLKGDMESFMCTNDIDKLEFTDEDSGGPLVCHSTPPKGSKGKGKKAKIESMVKGKGKFVPNNYVVGIILGTHAPGGYIRTSKEYAWIAKTANLRGSRINISDGVLTLALILSSFLV